MTVLKYQLKNIRRDKLCILTFLLPIIVGIVINLFSGMSFSSVSENSFGYVKDDLSGSTVEWLESYGTVTEFKAAGDLEAAVNEPSTQMIGVIGDNNGIRTILSGDEYQIYTAIAERLPQLYEGRDTFSSHSREIIPVQNDNDVLKTLLVVITMVTAMFMGCTFNAMSMISEKEDGIWNINDVLPMTKREYIFQKIALGFIGSTISTALTALICMKVAPLQIISLVVIILLSAFIAALAGLFIGRYSSGLMVGIVYIKIIMILFLAPPLVVYMAVPPESVIRSISYLLPSSATFYGLINLIYGQNDGILQNIVILCVHVIVWMTVFFVIDSRKPKARVSRSQ